MKNDAIIFDIDGTLWDATVASAVGWNNGLGNLGINKKISARDIQKVTGKPQQECVEILFPDLVKEYINLPEVLDKYEIEAIKVQGGIFYDGVINGIEKLSRAYKIFIVSNCQDWYLKLFFEKAGIGEFIFGYDCNGMSGLPKDEMLAKMKEKYSLINPVYVGDTASDEQATAAAGMEFIHVSYGFGKPQNNPKSFDSFYALVDYLTNTKV
jgi:phosphoglycolate phosphatase